VILGKCKRKVLVLKVLEELGDVPGGTSITLVTDRVAQKIFGFVSVTTLAVAKKVLDELEAEGVVEKTSATVYLTGE
jgi:hypothetical protein